jgi:hypothetical protein
MIKNTQQKYYEKLRKLKPLNQQIKNKTGEAAYTCSRQKATSPNEEIGGRPACTRRTQVDSKDRTFEWESHTH